MLVDTVSSGRELEGYATERGATGLPDIGYSGLEDRYNTLEVRGREEEEEEEEEGVGGGGGGGGEGGREGGGGGGGGGGGEG